MHRDEHSLWGSRLDLPDALFHDALEVFHIYQHEVRLHLLEPLEERRPVAAIMLFDNELARQFLAAALGLFEQLLALDHQCCG